MAGQLVGGADQDHFRLQRARDLAVDVGGEYPLLVLHQAFHDDHVDTGGGALEQVHHLFHQLVELALAQQVLGVVHR
ncbi:hypothetical protein D3C78_1591500 [compost metagenome]